MFFNHNVSRDGSSLETLWLKNIGTMYEVQKIDRSKIALLNKVRIDLLSHNFS
jgi:hypothetical protein